MLNSPVVPGLAADGLFTSILYFQKKHFPGTPSGFVDPGGPVQTKLESLASRAAAPPPKAAQWDNITSGSVNKALRKALVDLTIEHSEVVDIIRATLSNGVVSAGELADLKTIAATSRSISPRSKALLENFVEQVNFTINGKGPFKLPTARRLSTSSRSQRRRTPTLSIDYYVLWRASVLSRRLLQLESPWRRSASH